jgi:hypothetical protein
MLTDTTIQSQRFAEYAHPARPSVVQRPDVPAAIRRVSAMDAPDYVDVFTVTAPNAIATSAEEWARVTVDTAGLGGQFVWRVPCALRLDSRPAADRIGGWKVADHGDRWLRAEAASWFMTAHLVFMVDDDALTVATFIRYHHVAGRLIWPVLAVAHRALMPNLLRGTASRVRRLRRASSDDVAREPVALADVRGARS